MNSFPFRGAIDQSLYAPIRGAVRIPLVQRSAQDNNVARHPWLPGDTHEARLLHDAGPSARTQTTSQTLREDREAFILADRLGYSEAFCGEHLTDVAENIPSSMMFIAAMART